VEIFPAVPWAIAEGMRDFHLATHRDAFRRRIDQLKR
jgi:hypothetical protein